MSVQVNSGNRFKELAAHAFGVHSPKWGISPARHISQYCRVHLGLIIDALIVAICYD
jgi:hypothetical protein